MSCGEVALLNANVQMEWRKTKNKSDESPALRMGKSIIIPFMHNNELHA
jgi:hypothetical protein